MSMRQLPRIRSLRKGSLLALALLGLSGCVAYPAGGYYSSGYGYAPSGYAYAPAPGVYVGGGPVVGYGYYGGWGRGGNYRGWR